MRGIKKLALALLLTGTMFLSPTLAQESETTRQLDADAARYRELLEAQRAEQARLEASLGDLSAALSARLAERDEAGRELLELRGAREVLEDNVAQLEAELLDKRAQVEDLGVQQDALKARVQTLLMDLYKGRSSRLAGALFRTETYHDLRVKNHYLSLLSDRDATLLNDLSAAVAASETAQRELAARLGELESQEEALREAERELSAKRAELEGLVSTLESDREGREALRLENLRAQESLDNSITVALRRRDEEVGRLVREEEARKARAAAEAERQQREAERRAEEAAEAAAEAARLEAARAAEEEVEAARAAEAAARAAAERAAAEVERSAPSTPDTSNAPEGEAVSPFPNPRLLSRYGEAGATSVTLQAEQDGAAVHSVLPGEVVGSQFLTANTGYMVMIEHGPDLFTVYKNLQSPLVQSGDQVTRGQIVGYLGGGALALPDTLEFFVGVPRANGAFNWIDPAPLLGFR